jgi:hypothetical protein
MKPVSRRKAMLGGRGGGDRVGGSRDGCAVGGAVWAGGAGL